jgi:hypothetical protein
MKEKATVLLQGEKPRDTVNKSPASFSVDGNFRRIAGYVLI